MCFTVLTESVHCMTTQAFLNTDYEYDWYDQMEDAALTRLRDEDAMSEDDTDEEDDIQNKNNDIEHNNQINALILLQTSGRLTHLTFE